MSDVDSRGINGDVGDMDNICRDFLRNVCRRGKRCKYRHPEPGDKDMGRKTDFVFCHDFQNKECRRINCKFVHCTRSEEEYYHMTGEMPQHVQEALGISSLGSGRRGGSGGGGGGSGGGGGGLGGVDNSDIPICKDYQKGDCRRGGRCKFRHISPNEYDMEMGRGGVGNNGGGGNLRRYDSYGSMFNSGGGGGIGGGSGLGGSGGGGGGNGGGGGLYDSYEYYEPERKRRMYGHSEVGGGGGGGGGGASQQQLVPHGGGGGTSRQPSLVAPPPLPSDYYILEEENAFLRRRVEELKKQVSDLTATNEFLLDQNAQLRLGKQTAVAPIAQSINPNSIAPVVPPVQVSSGQMAQMTQLPVGDLAVAVPQPSCLSQELAAAAAPQTITPIVPVSMAPVSIAPVSIAQALPAASLVQSIPNPLVSYPIMTQGMRPALTPSSLTH